MHIVKGNHVIGKLQYFFDENEYEYTPLQP